MKLQHFNQRLPFKDFAAVSNVDTINFTVRRRELWATATFGKNRNGTCTTPALPVEIKKVCLAKLTVFQRHNFVYRGLQYSVKRYAVAD